MTSMSASVIDASRIPVHDVAAATVQNAAQVVERPADVDVRHVDVPVLMNCHRLFKARALLRRLPVPLRKIVTDKAQSSSRAPTIPEHIPACFFVVAPNQPAYNVL